MNDVQKKLFEKRKISLVGEVNEDMGKYLLEVLQLLMLENSPAISVSITSNGGNASTGLDLYDLLRFYPGKKIGIVHANAASMAAVILQGCDWRVITPNGRILIHHIRCHNFPIVALKNKNELDRFLRSRAHLFNQYEILAKRTGKTVEEIIARCEQDENMPAEEALEYKLIDQIIETESDIQPPWETAMS